MSSESSDQPMEMGAVNDDSIVVGETAVDHDDDDDKIALEPSDDNEERSEDKQGEEQENNKPADIHQVDEETNDREGAGDAAGVSEEAGNSESGHGDDEVQQNEGEGEAGGDNQDSVIADESRDESKADSTLAAMKLPFKGTYNQITGVWEGFWAMSDAEFESGLRSKFQYKRIPLDPEIEVGKAESVDGQPVDAYLSGWFNVQLPGKVDKRKESKLLLRFSATPEGEINVQGSGKNAQFGPYIVSGIYDVASASLELYRQYTPDLIDNNKSGSKKPVAPGTPGSASNRKTPRPTPRAPLLSQNWEGAAALGPAAAVSQRARRPPAHVVELGEEESKVKERMSGLIDLLLSQDKNRWFHTPVDPAKQGVANYFEVIQEPMDLGTVKNKLNTGAYRSEEQVEQDVLLTFTNAMTYNQAGNVVHEDAKRLMERFSNDFAKIIQRREERKRKSTGGGGSTVAPTNTSKANGNKKQKVSRQSSTRSEDSHYSEEDSFSSASQHVKAARTSSRRSLDSLPAVSANENEELRLLRMQVELMSKQLQTLQAVTLQTHLPGGAAAYQPDAAYVPPQVKRQRSAPKPKPKPAPQVDAEDEQYGDFDDEQPVVRAPKVEKPLSYQEKRALGQDINRLPPEKVQRVLDIIMESGQALGDGAEEVEIDIEKLDTGTLKALQKYVREALKGEKKKA